MVLRCSCLASLCSWHETHSPAGAESGAEGCSCGFRGHGCCFCRNVPTAVKTEQIKTKQYTRKGRKSNNKSNQTSMPGATLFSMVISLSMNHKKLPVSSSTLRCSKTPAPATVQSAAPWEEQCTAVYLKPDPPNTGPLGAGPATNLKHRALLKKCI